MATYQENIPSQGTFQFQPYQRNNSSVMNALSARTNYFLQSAQQVKNAYDSTFDFHLSNSTNIQALENDKANADNQLKSVLKSDMSISDNKTRAFNILKPVLSNQNYIYDEQITNSIRNGIGQAQSDVKKFGADHYNSLSVQSMNNTLNRWRNADPSDYVGYIDDTLGTTYQPYDPKIDSSYLKGVNDYVKNGIVTTDIPDGNGHIIVKKGASANSTEMQTYIRETMPQQMQTQKALEARLYVDRANSDGTPEGKKMVEDYFSNVANNNILKQQSYLSTEKTKLEYAYSNLSKEEQAGTIGTNYKAAIAQFYSKDDKGNETGLIPDAANAYQDFDPHAYSDPIKRNVAINQAQSLLLGQSVNGMVDGLGLANSSTTVKSDQAFWERAKMNQNADQFNRSLQFKQDELAAKNKKGNGTDEPNPNSFVSNNINDTGGAQASTDDNIINYGNATLSKIQGEPKSLLDQNISDLFSGGDKKGLGIVINNPSIGTTDIYTAFSNMAKDPTTLNTKAFSVLNNIVGGSEHDKALMKALLIKGYQLEGGKNVSDANINLMDVNQASRYLRNVSTNTEAFNNILSKFQSDSNDLETASKIGFNNSMIDFVNQSNDAKYRNSFNSAAKDNHIEEITKLDSEGKPVNFSLVANYNENNFVDYRKDKLKAYTPDQIAGITKYVGNGDESELLRVGISAHDVRLIPTAGKAADEYYNMMGNRLPGGNVPPEVKALRDQWAGYQNSLVHNLGNQKTPASNYNTLSLGVVDQFHKGMEGKEFARSDLVGILDNDISAFDENGNAISHKFTENLSKFMAAGGADDIANVEPHSDGTHSFLEIKMGKEFISNRKKLSDAGVDDDFLNDLPNLKIPVNNSVPELNFNMGKISSEKLKLLGGEMYGAHLASGNDFKFYNIGDGNNLSLKFDGSFNMVSNDDNGYGFIITNHVLDKSNVSDMMSGKNPLIPNEEGISLQPTQVASTLYKYDLNSKRVSDILQAAGIDITKHINWSDIPINIRQKLIKSSPSFTGFPTN